MPQGTPIYRNLIADYLDVSTTAGTPQYELIDVAETLDESPTVQTVEKTYTASLGPTTLTTGFSPTFALTMDRYQDNPVSERLGKLVEEYQLGVKLTLVRVNLFEPETEPNTYYARRFTVEPAIETLGGAGGEIATIEGALNAVGDVVIGTFDTTTRTFTEA